jgi:hypothetical protein
VTFTETPAADVERPSASSNLGWVEVDEDKEDGDVSVEVRWHAPQ